MSTVAFGLLNASKPWWALMIYMYLLVWGQILHPFVPVHDSVECSSFPRTYLFSYNFLLQECLQLMKNKNCILCSNSVAISYTKYKPWILCSQYKEFSSFHFFALYLVSDIFSFSLCQRAWHYLEAYFPRRLYPGLLGYLYKITVTFFTLGFEHCQTSR